MYNRYGWDREMWEAERRLEHRLLREVTEDRQPMSWRKLGKMIQLNAMLRSHDNRGPGNYFGNNYF